jgi:hypothetical protein
MVVFEERGVVMATCDVIVLCVTSAVIGAIIGMFLIGMTASKIIGKCCENAFKAGCEKGKADEQKKVMQKLEEYERSKKRAI